MELMCKTFTSKYDKHSLAYELINALLNFSTKKKSYWESLSTRILLKKTPIWPSAWKQLPSTMFFGFLMIRAWGNNFIFEKHGVHFWILFMKMILYHKMTISRYFLECLTNTWMQGFNGFRC